MAVLLELLEVVEVECEDEAVSTEGDGGEEEEGDSRVPLLLFCLWR